MNQRRNNFSNRKARMQVVMSICSTLLFFSQTTRAQVRGEKIGAPPSLTKTNSVASAESANASPSEETISTGAEKYLRVSFARLSSFRYKAADDVAGDANADSTSASPTSREQFPNTVKVLSEKQVAITGFMLPVHVVDGLATDFLLLKNQSACCYGVMPQVNEWVIVRTAGKGVKPLMDVPVTALGTLHVGEMRENGHLSGIYLLNLDQLEKPKE